MLAHIGDTAVESVVLISGHAAFQSTCSCFMARLSALACDKSNRRLIAAWTADCGQRLGAVAEMPPTAGYSADRTKPP